jgi:hypothetical protein
MEKEYYLERLLGKVITKTDTGTSIVIGRNMKEDDPNRERTFAMVQLFLEDYILNIENPMTIIPSGKELPDLEGLKVIATDENDEEAELIFDNGNRLIINLREEAYEGPEAMCLYGPDDFCVVWR